MLLRPANAVVSFHRLVQLVGLARWQCFAFSPRLLEELAEGC